ncbi:hypothetical protein ZWY2020_039414 [Hordeum vulgare]|nr:hypothetical protein ZWY2020_039414 [Hordeum vulgare]
MEAFISGECNNPEYPTRFHIERGRKRERGSLKEFRSDEYLLYRMYWCSFGPENYGEEGRSCPAEGAHNLVYFLSPFRKVAICGLYQRRALDAHCNHQFLGLIFQNDGFLILMDDDTGLKHLERSSSLGLRRYAWPRHNNLGLGGLEHALGDGH